MLATITQRLRQGVATPERGPFFDPRSRPIYAILAVQIAATIALTGYYGFTISARTLELATPATLLLLISGPLMRRVGHDQIGGLVETWALIGLQGLASALMLFPLTAIGAPLADAWLSRLDAMIGFDWLSLANALRGHRAWLSFLEIAYRTFNWEPVVVVLLLWALKQGGRAWQLVTASAIALQITILIYPFAPAAGAFVFHGISHAAYPNMHMRAAWDFGRSIATIRAGEREITPELMTGFVSFPSYHAAAAVMLAWGVWRTPLRWPFLLLNSAMAFSALICGAHYLIDILAGFAVAAAALILAIKLVDAGPQVMVNSTARRRALAMIGAKLRLGRH